MVEYAQSALLLPVEAWVVLKHLETCGATILEIADRGVVKSAEQFVRSDDQEDLRVAASLQDLHHQGV